MFVAVHSHHSTVGLWQLDRQDFDAKSPRRLRRRGTFLTAQRKPVLVASTDTVINGDIFSRFDHRFRAVIGFHCGIDKPPPYRRVEDLDVARESSRSLSLDNRRP